jgi:hypothetical protein
LTKILELIVKYLGMSISSVNEDPGGDCPTRRFEVGKFFSVGMEEKVHPKEVWGWR